MKIVADTNILVRAIDRRDPRHEEALSALRLLTISGLIVCVLPQTL